MRRPITNANEAALFVAKAVIAADEPRAVWLREAGLGVSWHLTRPDEKPHGFGARLLAVLDVDDCKQALGGWVSYAALVNRLKG